MPIRPDERNAIYKLRSIRVWQCMLRQSGSSSQGLAAVRLRYLYAPQDLASYLPLTIMAAVSATPQKRASMI